MLYRGSTLNLDFSGSEDSLLFDEEDDSSNPLNAGVCCVAIGVYLVGVYTGTPEEDELVDLAAELDELVLLACVVVVLGVLALFVFVLLLCAVLGVDLLLDVVVLRDVVFLLALVAGFVLYALPAIDVLEVLEEDDFLSSSFLNSDDTADLTVRHKLIRVLLIILLNSLQSIQASDTVPYQLHISVH